MECLRELSRHYEIMIFTASHSCYANVILDHLDPNKEYIHHRLYREHCTSMKEGLNIKDLRILKDRNLSDVVLVDNSAISFAFQLDNGIPILPYYNNKEDRELLHLIEYLKPIALEPDLREHNRVNFKLRDYLKYLTPREILENTVFKD